MIELQDEIDGTLKRLSWGYTEILKKNRDDQDER